MRATDAGCQIALIAVIAAGPTAAGAAPTAASHVADLVELGSRVTGYPGATAAADLIAQRLRQFGLAEVYLRPFTVPVPIDGGAEITSGDEALALHGMWPNLARTPATGPEGLTGPLVDAARGRLDELSGTDLRGAVALLDYDCADDWVRVFDLGAAAAIFVASPNGGGAPLWARRSEGAAKFLSTPADLPRFYAPPDAGERLRQLAMGRPAVTVRARMAWQLATATTVVAVVPGRDPEVADQGLVIGAYYDAISPVPALCPGADQASGAAAWLELARQLASSPPRRTAVLVAAPGHFQALAGMRDFVGLLQRAGGGSGCDLERRLAGLRIGTVLCLDLSSHGHGLALVQGGTPYRVRTVRPQLFDAVEAWAQRYETEELGGHLFLGGDLKPLAARRRLGQLPESIPLDGAVASLAGYLGLTLVTAGDGRALFDSPEDREPFVDGASLDRQAAFAGALVRHLLDGDADVVPQRGKDSFGRLTGRFVVWGPGSFQPQEPVADALVRVRSLHHVLVGVRPDPVALTDGDGGFGLEGLEARTLYLKPVELEAYGQDPENGRLQVAVDRGPFGAAVYPLRVSMDHNDEECTLVGFAGRSLTLTDLLDPYDLVILDHPRLLDGAGDADLERYGYCLPASAAEVEERGYWDSAGPRRERVGVLFVPADGRVKVTLTSGRLGVGQRLVLLKATPEAAFGLGYGSRDGPVLWGTAARAAADLGALNQRRLADLEGHGIRSAHLRQLHERQQELVATADRAFQRGLAAEFVGASRQAWSLGLTAHRAIAGVGTDAVAGVLFLLLALLPFSVFAERLLLEASQLRWQVAGTVVVFAAAFAWLRYSHPAFDLTLYPMVVLVGFLILALSAAVTSIGLGRLNDQLRQSVSPMLARHRVDPRRTAMMGRALLLGVAQMRRRPLRTGLTCATLALLTFSLVCFTSVRSSAGFYLTPLARGGGPGPDAVALRRPGWAGLEGGALDHLRPLLAAAPAARLWYSQTALLHRGQRTASAPAVLGLDAQEPRVTGVAGALAAGRWFEAGELRVCILPDEQAAALGVTAADLDTAGVTFLGERYRVVGIADSRAFDALVDISGGSLTPLDLDGYQPEERRAGVDRRGEAPAFAHLPARQVAILPAAAVADLGGHARLASVAAPLAGGRAELERLAPTLGLNLFARLDGRCWLVDTGADHTFRGERGVWVPLLIAALILFNAMLGSVYERVPEIGTFNAVGLAPGHVAGLFLAEAGALATLGGVSGYLAALGVSRVGLAAGLFPGLTVNASSYAAVVTLMGVMGLVLLSALYPARVAGRLCVPGIERAWQLPRPDGDRLHLEMPFSLRPPEAVGLARFVAEYIASCDEQSIGAGFYAEEVCEAGGSVTARVWLAPFDSGVSQSLRIRLVLQGDRADYAALVLTLQRRSGEAATWLRANRLFVDGLRRQFLMWRSLEAAGRALYTAGRDGG